MAKLYSCFKCKQHLPKESFYSDKSRTTDISSSCKVCCNSRKRSDRWHTKEYYKEAVRRGTKKRDAKPSQKIKNNLRRRIRSIWSKRLGDVSAIRHLGCTYKQFLEHIQKQFKPGMTLENYGKWHIDHIKPLCSFDLTDTEEVRKASHYTNLQPLWAKDNLTKSSKAY